MRTLIVLIVGLMVVGCENEAPSQKKPINEIVPRMMNEMEDRYSKKGVSVTALRLFHEKGEKYTGTGEFTWKNEKYKFTLDLSLADDSYKWNATPLTGNQELIKIFKYSTY